MNNLSKLEGTPGSRFEIIRIVLASSASCIFRLR